MRMDAVNTKMKISGEQREGKGLRRLGSGAFRLADRPLPCPTAIDRSVMRLRFCCAHCRFSRPSTPPRKARLQ